MSNITPPVAPVGGGDDDFDDEPQLIDVDGERLLDPDSNDDLIDSAEADRLAAGGDPDGS